MSRRARKPRGRAGQSAGPRRRPLLWLFLPTVIVLPLVVLSLFWRLPTRVQVDLATARLAFTPGGTEPREILGRSVPFSSLVVEDCRAVSFTAEALAVADPLQIAPATAGSTAPAIPAAAWRAAPAGPVQFLCRDPAAKLTLNHPDPAAPRLGLLDRLWISPGSLVILEVSPGREPALAVEAAALQELRLALDGPDLELVTDLLEPVGFAAPVPGSPLTWRTRLPAARRTVDLTSGDEGLVLIITPERGRPADLFRQPLDLPLTTVELLLEDLEGSFASPLRDRAKLTYPDYLDIPAVSIESDEALGLHGLSKARLRSLAFDSKNAVLRARFDGVAERAVSRAGDQLSDHRLTLFHTFRYSWRWSALALVAAWLVSTTWAAYEAWKKLRE